VTYAQWVAPGSLEQFPALARLADRRLFLTKVSMYLLRPSDIDRDFVFRYAPRDETYRAADVEYQYVSPWFLILPGLALAAGMAGLIAMRNGQGMRR